MATPVDIQRFFDALGPHIQLHQIGADEPTMLPVAKVLEVSPDPLGDEYFSVKLLPIGAGPYTSVVFTAFTAPVLVAATPNGVIYQAQKPGVEYEGEVIPNRVRFSTIVLNADELKQAQDTIRWYESDE